MRPPEARKIPANFGSSTGRPRGRWHRLASGSYEGAGGEGAPPAPPPVPPLVGGGTYSATDLTAFWATAPLLLPSRPDGGHFLRTLLLVSLHSIQAEAHRGPRRAKPTEVLAFPYFLFLLLRPSHSRSHHLASSGTLCLPHENGGHDAKANEPRACS